MPPFLQCSISCKRLYPRAKLSSFHFPVSQARGTSLFSKRLLTGAVAFPVFVCAIEVKATELSDTLAKEERTAAAVVVGKLEVGPEDVNAAELGTVPDGKALLCAIARLVIVVPAEVTGTATTLQSFWPTSVELPPNMALAILLQIKVLPKAMPNAMAGSWTTVFVKLIISRHCRAMSATPRYSAL